MTARDQKPGSLAVDTDVVVAAMAQHAAQWLGGDEPGTCIVRTARHREQSTLIWARLTAGSASADVVAKIPRGADVTGISGRLFAPVADPLVKAEFEHRTITTVCRGFSASADARWGCADPVGYLPELGVVVVRELTSPTLDQLLRGHAGSSVVRPEEALANLGSWLTVFQGFETPHMEPRDTVPDRLVGGVNGLIDAVRAAGRGAWLPRGIDSVVERFEHGLSSGDLPIGLGHGDLAPRNVFVGPTGRVTVIDSLGRFAVPVHEDVAYLLVELTVGANRFARRGLPKSPRSVAHLRSAFLVGRGLDDDAVLGFFEFRALLDKWRSIAQRGAIAGSPSRLTASVSSARELLIATRLRRVTKRLGAEW